MSLLHKTKSNNLLKPKYYVSLIFVADEGYMLTHLLYLDKYPIQNIETIHYYFQYFR